MADDGAFPFDQDEQVIPIPHAAPSPLALAEEEAKDRHPPGWRGESSPAAGVAERLERAEVHVRTVEPGETVGEIPKARDALTEQVQLLETEVHDLVEQLGPVCKGTPVEQAEVSKPEGISSLASELHLTTDRLAVLVQRVHDLRLRLEV